MLKSKWSFYYLYRNHRKRKILGKARIFPEHKTLEIRTRKGKTQFPIRHLSILFDDLQVETEDNKTFLLHTQQLERYLTAFPDKKRKPC